MIDFRKLNPPQRTAVEQTEGPLLILAGAGSGKTRVLTYRIAHLMDQGVPAWKILAITFTNKAAREMAERVKALTGEAGEDAWVSTFHSFCAKVLRRDIEKLGYQRSFTIYDESDCQTVIKTILKQMNLGEKDYPPKGIKHTISDAKNRLLTPEEWLEESEGQDRDRKIFEIYRSYEKALFDNNALDFDDLLVKALELFVNNPPVLQYYQDRFDYIMVDEYQDTNKAQYELVKILAQQKQNLCVVGDDDQSIYGWRGADIRNILDFENDFPNAKVIKLEQNYRSTGNILDAANQVIANNRGRKDKALWTESEAGDKVMLYRALDERDEAYFIARMAAKLIRQGTPPSEIGVLYRTNAQSRVIEEAFVRGGVPYRVFGGLRFYDRKEVKDLIAYIGAVVNPMNDVAVRRIINEPKRGIGDTTVDKLAEYAYQQDDSLMNAVLDYESVGLSGRAAKAVASFQALMIDLTGAFYEMKPGEFLQAVIDKTGYVELLKAENSPEAQTRIENIKELQGAVSEFEAQNPDEGLETFLEQASLMTDMDTGGDGQGIVSLMTLHAAKGLEFDAVFIPGMEESIFPLTKAQYDDDALEEERRLAYVGITRAKKKLFLCHANTRMLYNQRGMNPVSRFVEEIPRRLVSSASARRENEQVPRPTGYQRQISPYRPSQGYTAPRQTYVASQARSIQPVELFKVGDRVIHKRYGVGTVVAVQGAGMDQIVKIDLGPNGVREFNASAPIAKVGG